MSPDRGITEEQFPAAARDALERVVAAGERAVIESLRRAGLSRPAYAACIYYSPDDDELLDPPGVYVGLDSDRERALSTMDRGAAFREIWNPMTYRGGELEPEGVRETLGFADAETLVAEALAGLACEDRARWVLNRVARRATNADLRLPHTPDFVVFVLDPDLGEALLENVRFAAPAAVADELETKGLLPSSFDELQELYADK